MYFKLIITIKDVATWLSRLVTALLLQRLGFVPETDHVRFVDDKVTLVEARV